VKDGDLKARLARRGSIGLTCLAIGVAGVAWSGCGGSGSAKSIEEKAQSGITEVEQSVEKGFEEAKEQVKGKSKKQTEALEAAEKATKEGLQKGKETAKSVTEEVEKAQKEYGTP
jgi:hypothetical protein